MIIGIDGNEANIPTRVGVGQYAYHLLTALSCLDSSNQYHVYLKSPPLSDMPPSTPHWQYHIFGPKKLWTKVALPLHLFCDHRHLDLFFSPSHYSPQFSPFPTLPTIHDLGYLRTKEQFTKKDLYQLISWTKHSLDHATHIIAVSQFTKDNLIESYQISPNQISIVYNGVESPPPLNPTVTQKTLRKFNIDTPYFLALGTLKPSKNYPFLIRSFSQYLQKYPSNHHLVIAGKKGWLFDNILKTTTQENCTDKVIFTDYITEDEKWVLLKNAICLIIPSTYEGFGIPAIESQKIGTPVIASNIPPLKEILDGSAIFVNPSRSRSLIQALIDVQNPILRRRLIERGVKQSAKFTWESSAKSLLTAFSSLS